MTAARVGRRYWRFHALRLVPNSFSDLLIPVLFRHHHGRAGYTRGVAWTCCLFFGSFP